MDVITNPIRSDSNPESPYPWYELDVDESADELAITTDHDGGREAALQNATTNLPGHVDLPEESSLSESGDVVYAVTDDGDFIAFDPENVEALPSLRAHLGWYESSSDTLTLLEFRE